MKNNMSVRLQVGLAAAMALLLATTTALAAGRNPNHGVLPVNSRAHGKSYGEWGAAWWTALFSIPVMNNDHPLFSGGAFGGEKGVVFLAATGGGEQVVKVGLGLARLGEDDGLPGRAKLLGLGECDVQGGQQSRALRNCQE